MTDWVHCNSCYTRYKSSIKFNFTSCGHILCEKCLLEMGNKSSCAICKLQFQCIPVSNNLDPQLECFFRPAQVHLEKSKQILNFQQNNALSLLKHVTQKYNYAKNELLKLYKTNKELKKENETLKRQLARPSFTSSSRGGGGHSNSRKAPSYFSINRSDGSTIFNNNRRLISQQGPLLWNQHGVGRPMKITGVEAVSSFESQDVSAVTPSRGSGPSSSIHRSSFRRVGPSPILPMSHLHLRSGKGNPEQK